MEIQSPSQLNNQAVLLVQGTGCFDDAIPIFSHAMAICKIGLANLKEQEQQEVLLALSSRRETQHRGPRAYFGPHVSRPFLFNTGYYHFGRFAAEFVKAGYNNNNEATSESKVGFQEEHMTCSPMLLHGKTFSSSTPTKERFIFSSLIQFPNDRVAIALPHGTYFELISIAALFNVAIAMHMKAEMNGDREQLLKALALYELVCRNLSGTTPRIFLDDRTYYTMILALANNRGEIYEVLGDSEKTKESYARLLGMSMLLRFNGLEDQIPSGTMQGFFSNTSSIILKDPCIAPAA